VEPYLILLETPVFVGDWFADLLLKFGLPLAELIVVTVAFVSGRIVPRYVYDDAVKQRDRATGALEGALNTAELAASLTEKAVRSRVRR
jgi:hypothetical protein